jgi:alpha-L-fucosidase 2
VIWPYSVTGLAAPDFAIAKATWNTRPRPYDNIWANDAIQAARLGMGDQVLSGMKTMLKKYQSYPNGFTNNTNGVFEYWGVHLIAMNESLFQSHDHKLRVFPALPTTEPNLVTRFTLAAKDGFLVSSEREVGEIKYVGLKSVLGKHATVENPWPGTAVQVRRLSNDIIVTSGTSAELSFDTEAGAVYVLERTAKPLSHYTYAFVTASANQSSKHLSDNSCTLGIAK